MADDPLHQIIITTHTPEIAKQASLDQIIFIKKKERVPYIVMDSDNKFSEIINTLGIHDSIKSKVVICVEGENDINFFKNIGKIEEFKQIIDLSKGEVAIIPMHGGT